jgi:hypothetical protein
MSDQIERLACALSESSNEVSLKQAEYRAASDIHEGIKDKLTAALNERKETGTTAIALDDDEILLCLWIGLNSYEFSLIRLYN